MLTLDQSVLETVLHHARQTYPEECCGVLLGTMNDTKREAVRAIEIRNTKDGNRLRRYEITPEDYKNAERRADALGLFVIGLYHSHPDHPAQPSQFDLGHALPWWSYVIVSVVKGEPGVLRSWLLRDDRSAFDEEELAVPAS